MTGTFWRNHMVILALALMALVLAPTAASALTPGTGAWYWPTGTEDFGGMSGWWDDRGGSWHLAQDMAAPCGRSVYAIADGTVLESKYVGGYGAGGTTGGAVVILHKTATGEKFKALYGHLSNLRFEKGDTVQGGTVIGTVNNSSPNHLHFGIHPGEAYPHDNNPFRGHTYTSTDDYGFVDPVAYLLKHPRVIPYVAPAVPVVASITTTTAPEDVGVACGVAYWSDGSGEQEHAWSYDIATKKMSLRSDDETLPAFDAKRYVVSVQPSRPGFTVRDRRPALTLVAAHSTPLPGGSARLTGGVANATGQAFGGARVSLQRLTRDGWTTVADALSNSEGCYAFTYRPSSRTHLRVRFSPPDTYVTSASATVSVAPHVTLTQPSLSPEMGRGGPTFEVTSYLTPTHSLSGPGEIVVDRYSGGKWVRVARKRARVSTIDGRTRCRGSFSCSEPGTYRVRTFVPDDSAHAATYSPALSFAVD